MRLRPALLLPLLAALACERRAPPPAPAASLAAVHLDGAPPDWTQPVPPTPAGGIREAGYVGSATCKDCHAKLFASYARHSMARSGLRPLSSLDQRWLAGIFDRGAHDSPVQHERSRFYYRPFRQGQRYFIEEYLLGPDGSKVQSWTQPIVLSLSAGGYGMSFYFRQGSRLYQAPIDYYAKAGRWGLDPGASAGNFRFFRPLHIFCISCHSDYPARRAGSDEVFLDPLPTGIGCERCHGPGARHVETLKKEDIVNPARLSARLQLDVCVQCHQSTLAVLRGGRHDFSYRPGQPMADFRINFVGEPAETDRFQLLAHAERMARSACWRGSRGKLTCTSCHDPHKSSFEQPAEWWDQKCQACHQQKPCTAPAAARAAEGDHCIRCHMRGGPPSNVPLVTVTDHWIQRRPPPIKPGNVATPERLVSWPAYVGAPVSGDDLPAVEAVALGQDGRTDEAERLAASVLDHKPRVPELYWWLEDRLEQRGRRREAADAYAAVLRFDPDSRTALLGYARSMLDRNTPEAAAEANRALERSLALDPDDYAVLEIRCIQKFRDDHADEAGPLCARAAAAGTTSAASHVALAVLARRAGRQAELIEHLEAARRVEPADAWVLDQLAGAYAKLNDRAHADEVAHARSQLVALGRQPSITSVTRWLPPSWR